MEPLKPFQAEKHEPFFWDGGQAAALLIHGFPGTPAEVRPLAASLHQAGWSVEGILLPGFGSEIETLPDRSHSEWVAAVEAALRRLKEQYHPTLLIGYSMGAALAVQAAVAQPPTGLVLLAPFRQYGSRWQQVVGKLLRPFFREIYPFKDADFADPQVRRGILNFFPHIDLDDAAIQQSLRELHLPTRILDELNQVGHKAHRLANQLDLPALVIQGIQDDVVLPKHARDLLMRLPGPVTYAEVDAGHDLVSPEQPVWIYIEKTVLSFAQKLVDIKITP